MKASVSIRSSGDMSELYHVQTSLKSAGMCSAQLSYVSAARATMATLLFISAPALIELP